jgi:hypothetical protein
MNTLKIAIATLIVASATAYAAPSHAAGTLRVNANHGAVGCHASDPHLLDINAQGVTNISGGDTMVTCGGVATPTVSGGDVVVYETSFNNLGSDPVTVNCTLVDGIANFTGAAAKLYPKSVVVNPGDMAWIDWDSTDAGGSSWDSGPNYYLPALTCNLPDQTQIAYTAIIFYAETGN